MNTVASSERTHIGFFGLRNSGKSSLVNAVTGQNLSLVSDVKGTTTDPVYKTMELLPLGPVVIIDTPGIDDVGNLGSMRVQKAYQVLDKIHIGVLVVDITKGISEYEENLIKQFDSKKIPYIIVYTKADLCNTDTTIFGSDQEFASKKENQREARSGANNHIVVSSKTGYHIEELKERLARLIPDAKKENYILANFISEGDIVVLVVPIDSAAPKGRLIMPQQMTLREVLDCHAIGIVCQDTELKETLQKLSEDPKLVVTDSQVFGKVKDIVPEHIPLTSFSLLMMRYKGLLDISLSGASRLDALTDGDTVLISEGCTHHRQCEDIGTVKLPAWISSYTSKKLNFEFTSGREFPEDLTSYALVIHCGGCMLNEREMNSRAGKCAKQNVPFTNYGCIISKVNGILERATEIFKE